MRLEEYRSKRDFARTPEPAGTIQPSDGPLRFAVQEHDASRLHYDLRIELGGVLKSWAVPKGPSMNPREKRLAVRTEDHPLEYRVFEGVIPEGAYGAGAVMVWDEGTYCAPDTCERDQMEQRLSAGLDKGHISFILNGRKLRGRFALTRMKNSKDEDAWLLIKADDEFATDEEILREDLSVLSHRTLQEIASESAQAGDVWLPAKELGNLDLSDAPEAPMPHDVRPMLATLVDSPFDDPGWIFEVKWDGYRAIAEVERGSVKLYSRNLLSFNRHFPGIVEALPRIGVEAVLDGEVVVVDEHGAAQFQLLQNYLRTRQGTLVYYVFDILYVEGHDLRGLPLTRRKEILRAMIPDLPNIRLSDSIQGEGTALMRLASAQGLEGIVAKKADSPYRAGIRSRDWLKVRAKLRQEFVIGGFTEPRGSREYFGALVLGVFQDDKLVYVGHAGSGLDEKGLAYVRQKLDPLERPTPPFESRPKTNMPAHWVEPLLVCEVEFSGWTEDGLLRHPVILGLREDKPAREVIREVPEPVMERSAGKFAHKPEAKKDKEVEIGGHTLKLTNLDKVFWPDDGYMKGDLIAYYRDVADVILPHLKDRPESLNRHPDGIKGESFYQKNVGAEMVPEWMQTVRVADEEREYINYLLCQDEAALVFLANLGCIELNPWISRVGSLDRPDYSVIDLDPLDISFDAVIEAAQAVHEILESAGIPSCCKTSGATGLHIFVPLGAQYAYDQSRDFARIVAYLANARLPRTTSVERSPARRPNKVYLDCLQNRPGQTLAAVYCVRPQPGAPVSTPLTWDEVRPGLDPSSFNIRTIARRIEKRGELFQFVLGPGIDLVESLERLGRVSDKTAEARSA